MEAPSARRSDDGFTLVELMVVVLIIAILLGIAIPTYLGTRKRASDRAVQSNLRNAYTNQQAYYTEAERFADAGDIDDLDQSLDFTALLSDLGTTPRSVYVTRPSASSVILGARSAGGHCFWLRAVGGQNVPRFASNTTCVVPPDAEFTESW